MSRNHRCYDATLDVRTYGSLALAPVSAAKPQLTVIEGGRGSGVLHADPFAHVDRNAQASSIELRHAIISVVAIALISLLIVCGSMLSDALASPRLSQLPANVATTRIVVHKGDSIWALAEQHPLAGLSTRDVVNWIKQENDLSTSVIIAGQQLVVPDACA